MDAILGRDDRLVEKIGKACEKLSADFIAVIGTPVPAVIGTDYKALSRMIEKKTGIPALTIDTDGGEWNVFYMQANTSGSTQIAVPQDATYTVSGDNVGGFIVAYQEAGTAAVTTAVDATGDAAETTVVTETTAENAE